MCMSSTVPFQLSIPHKLHSESIIMSTIAIHFFFQIALGIISVGKNHKRKTQSVLGLHKTEKVAVTEGKFKMAKKFMCRIYIEKILRITR